MQQLINCTLDRLHVYGQQFRQQVRHDLLSKLLLKEGRDTLTIFGAQGTGKRLVCQLAHELGHMVLGLQGDIWVIDLALSFPELKVQDLLNRPNTSTIVFQNAHVLSGADRTRFENLIDARNHQANKNTIETPPLMLITWEGIASSDLLETPHAISLTPLNGRASDIREIANSFLNQMGQEFDIKARAFTRQALSDISQAVEQTQEVSVAKLRNVVLQVVLSAKKSECSARRIDSELTLPILGELLQFQAVQRAEADQVFIENRLEQTIDAEMLKHLSELHNIAPQTLAKLAEALTEIMSQMEGVPRSYRNIVERWTLLMRVSFWLISKAKTQAEFRKFFGAERHMIPTKSVAWQLFHDVFRKKDSKAA
jgi:hypothetical protein